MTDSAYKVETTPRLAQWRIHNLSFCTYRKSDPFKIGIWNWHLAVETNQVLYVKLYPEISNQTRENPPIASFIIQVVCSVGNRKGLIHPEITDKQLNKNGDFIWTIELPLPGKVIIEVEFLDLKIASPDGGGPRSIWSESFPGTRAHVTSLASLSKLLTDRIFTDITINTSNGSIDAHRAILAAQSSVFRSMFSHNLKEKQISSVDILDMSFEDCRAFLNYIYGTIQHEEFLTHRLALLHAADKYDVCHLKDVCHESLVDDIDCTNVLERIQNAYIYELPELKMACMRYLVDFGKIYDIQDELHVFLQCGDRNLIAEIFHEVLNAWKGF